MNSNGDETDPASSLGVQHLLSCLEQINVKVGGSDLDLLFLKNLLRSEDVQALLRIHEKVATPEVRNNKPLVDNAHDLLLQVVESLDCTSCSPGGIELLQILTDFHFKGFLEAHDGIAKRHYQPQLTSLPYEVDEDEAAVKIVCLVKGPTEPLGATIHQDRKTGTIKVARIMHGGVADRSGLIMEGDEIHEVNGKRVTGRPPDEVISILSSAVGNVTLKLIPADFGNGLYRDNKVRVRAHFDYNPKDDKLIPCKEAGLSFKRGDILHIVSQEDATWWQARIEGGGRTRAGLIPGKQLQEKREATKVSPVSPESPSTKDKEQKGHRMGGMFSPKSLVRRTRRVKRIVSCGQLAEDTEPEEIVTPYEDVTQYYPKAGVYRPIILIGPPGVGRKTLVQRLMSLRSGHFKTPVTSTSRPKKVTEISGETFAFVARDEMERDINSNRFVDHWEVGGHLYATSMEQIISVVNEGSVSIICPQPQALKQLHVAELKPYVIFIKPPAFERLKQGRTAANAKLSSGGVWSQTFKDDDFREMLHTADRIETSCSHYFDCVLVNEDLQETVEELCHIADRLELEPSWMPSVWLH